jgi:2-methylcitrate dehydratase PrpD
MIEATRLLSEHISSIKYEDLPADVVKSAKQHILDGLGNQIAAAAIAEPAKIMLKLLKRWGGAQEGTVVGYGYRFPAPLTALANAMLGHGVELDDAHGKALTKAGSSLIPTIMSISESETIDGKTIIAALVAGYEAAIRIGLAINPSHRRRGYHASGTAGTFGTAAATARALGLDAERTAWALGIASMQAAGIQPFLKSPSMVKPFSPGKAAFNGVIAGLMAKEDFIGPVTALENEEGFLKAYVDEVNYEELTRGYKSEWKILEVGYKPHAACRYAHGPIDATLYLKHKFNISFDEVDRIVLTMCELSQRQSGNVECANLNQSMGSSPFSVSLSLSRGANDLIDYWEGFKDKRIHEMARKVEIVVDRTDPGMGIDGRAAIAEIILKNGKSFRHRVEGPKGEPNNPLSDEELYNKFISLGRMVLPMEKVQKIAEMVNDFENLESVSILMSNTVVKSGEPVLLS